jgi:hypothetical protein
MKTTAADILIDTIYDWGVEVVFGLPGDGINGIMSRFESAPIRSGSFKFATKKLPYSWRAPTRNTLESSGCASPLPARAAFIC